MSFTVLWACLYCGAVTMALVQLLARGHDYAPLAKPAVLAETLLVRPCAGVERGLADRLSTTGGLHNVVLAVRDRSDSAFPAACLAVQRLRGDGIHAEVVITEAQAPNMKAAQIARVLAARSCRLVAIADSDVELPPDLFPRMAGELSLRGLGALWAPFVLETPRGVAGGILNGSLHAFPLLAGIDPKGFVGKVFIARADALASAGGFDAVCDRLGEDVALARRLHEAGFATGVGSTTVRVSGGAGVERFLRWALVVRAERPLFLIGYPLFIAALPLALLLAIFARGPLALGALSLVVLMRLLLSFALAPRADLLSCLAADFVLVYAAARAAIFPRATWRGRSLRIVRGGRLVCEAAPAPSRERS